ncbi:MAG: type II secretion system F family protein [Deltaproteobacteria bacterium]|nr:type II secretion system F family protein [Deltaproteobacteria bacterium]
MFNLFLVILAAGLIGIAAIIYYSRRGDADFSGGFESAKMKKAVSQNLRNMVAAQRASGEAVKFNKLTEHAAREADVSREEFQKSYDISLERRLKYGQMDVTPSFIRIMQGALTIIIVLPLALTGSHILALLFALMAPSWVIDYVNRRMEKRFMEFDKDYATMLMSYVSLLKTGMNTLVGLQAAAEGLSEESLVRAEIELMLERIKLGVTEEQAIGSFAEDVAHPEVELFLQCLILSRRLGGNLSGTLERLAKQVRKRAQFRGQAKSAIGMEKGSLWGVVFVMGGLMAYLTFTAPDLFGKLVTTQTGWQLAQAGIFLIVIGIYWSSKIAKIKV